VGRRCSEGPRRATERGAPVTGVVLRLDRPVTFSGVQLGDSGGHRSGSPLPRRPRWAADDPPELVGRRRNRSKTRSPELPGGRAKSAAAPRAGGPHHRERQRSRRLPGGRASPPNSPPRYDRAPARADAGRSGRSAPLERGPCETTVRPVRRTRTAPPSGVLRRRARRVVRRSGRRRIRPCRAKRRDLAAPGRRRRLGLRWSPRPR
jgi:hypothetical protein